MNQLIELGEIKCPTPGDAIFEVIEFGPELFCAVKTENELSLHRLDLKKLDSAPVVRASPLVDPPGSPVWWDGDRLFFLTRESVHSPLYVYSKSKDELAKISDNHASTFHFVGWVGKFRIYRRSVSVNGESHESGYLSFDTESLRFAPHREKPESWEIDSPELIWFLEDCYRYRWKSGERADLRITSKENPTLYEVTLSGPAGKIVLYRKEEASFGEATRTTAFYCGDPGVAWAEIYQDPKAAADDPVDVKIVFYSRRHSWKRFETAIRHPVLGGGDWKVMVHADAVILVCEGRGFCFRSFETSP